MCSYISNTVNRMYKDICFLLFSVSIVSELSSATSDRGKPTSFRHFSITLNLWLVVSLDDYR